MSLPCQAPEEFIFLKFDSKIHFTVDSVIHISSAIPVWDIDDQIKSSATSDSNVIDPDSKLNIWECNIGNGILGYAQFPGNAPETDGIVVSPQYFETRRLAQDLFDEGRTTTHDIGH